MARPSLTAIRRVPKTRRAQTPFGAAPCNKQVAAGVPAATWPLVLMSAYGATSDFFEARKDAIVEAQRVCSLPSSAL